MKAEPQPKFMDFMMNLLENMEILMFGSILLKYLIIFLFARLLNPKYNKVLFIQAYYLIIF